MPPYARHVYHLYAVQTTQRDVLHQALEAEGIRTGLHYRLPVHLQPAYADLGGQVGDHPYAEAAAAATLTLPVYPELPAEVPARIAEVVRRTLQHPTRDSSSGNAR